MALNKSCFDHWSFAHAGVGALMGLSGFSRRDALIVAFGTELVENGVLRGGFDGYFEECLCNIGTDLLLTYGMFELLRYLVRLKQQQSN